MFTAPTRCKEGVSHTNMAQQIIGQDNFLSYINSIDSTYITYVIVSVACGQDNKEMVLKTINKL